MDYRYIEKENENENDYDTENNVLNDDWINKFDKVDELYKDFYKDDVYYVDLKIVYVNRSNEIEKIKKTPFLMSSPNCISREEMLGILKKSAMEDNRKYSLLSILRYNILLEPYEIKNYLLDSCNDNDTNYLNIIKNIDTIYFGKTITMFQDLNDLILIFYEKSEELKKVDPNTCTKRIYLNSLNGNKKTIKKRYKD
jgi:hypothetical protein